MLTNRNIKITQLSAQKNRVNWIHAIATFTNWRNAITKTRVGNMPLELPYTCNYAILSLKRIKDPKIHVF
jgi:hypothetical protein